MSSLPLVSILLNTIDRYDITVNAIGNALDTAGTEFELLWCDNGSSDKRVIEYMRTKNPVYERLNVTNEGCAQMHNQMLLRANADYFCLLDNDILIRRNNWLRDLLETYIAVPDSGMAGIHTDNLCPEQHAIETVEGRVIHTARPPKEDAVFGTRLFSRHVLNTVGFFSETFGVYGLVDNAYNSRVHHSGFRNYYIGGPSGLHMDMDVGHNTEYRRMKDAEMRKNGPVFQAEIGRMHAEKNFYLPPPELR